MIQNIFLLFELFLAIACCAFIMSLTQSLWNGAPFVPSKDKDVDEIFRKVGLKKGMKFLELGCGDGRVVCKAVKNYGVIGRGVDVSWLWLICARVRAHIMGIHKQIVFRKEDIRMTDIAWADVIYLYMMPRFLDKYAEVIFAKCRPGTLVISYTFDIPALKGKEESNSTDNYYVYSV